jgi:hypothetical protein
MDNSDKVGIEARKSDHGVDRRGEVKSIECRRTDINSLSVTQRASVRASSADGRGELQYSNSQEAATASEADG